METNGEKIQIQIEIGIERSEITTDLVDVAVALPLHATFTYRVPHSLSKSVQVGQRVLVPFGPRRITGYIIGAVKEPPNIPLKKIVAILDQEPLFPKRMLFFFKWMAEYYIHPLGEVIQAALPSGINLSEQVRYEIGEAGRQELAGGTLASAHKAVLERLAGGPCRAAVLRRLHGDLLTKNMLVQWEKKGWVVRRRALVGGRTRPKTERFVSAVVQQRSGKISKARQAVLDLLKRHENMAVGELKKKIPTAANLIRVMARDGQVTIEERAVYRDPLGAPITPDSAPELTEEQRLSVEKMEGAIGAGYQTFLLSGVTGSGKTEVYLQMAARVMAKGLSVLVLVPEIALISQTERAFRARFGDCVALLHSGLSNGERLDQWQRIQRREADIAIGARSAVFAPFDTIGLIIVDEEHDDSYKQEGAFRYNARDLAVVRARQTEAVAILGSATPSLHSAYNAQIGKFIKVSMFERVDSQSMPRITIKDLTALKEERGIQRFLTPALTRAMAETLSRKEQVLIFLNRRGFANTLVCAVCGQPLRCAHCDICLTYHQKDNAYRCHYCGFSCASVSRCSRCGSDRINRLGIGTEQLTEHMRQRFPGARVTRMDRDTTRRKGALVKILRALRDGKIDILVGTQMVAKGHDYPNITLVGIICADLSLNMPDFRAGERTFQLLAQVAGRAGRGRSAGRVILQTYNPLHFSIGAARDQDFEAFYRQEMQFRKVLDYPPFTRMIQIRISGPNQKRVAGYAKLMGAACQSLFNEKSEYRQLTILGPIEAPLPRIADQYRWQLLIKGRQVTHLHQFVHRLCYGPAAPPPNSAVTVALDVDPVYLM